MPTDIISISRARRRSPPKRPAPVLVCGSDALKGRHSPDDAWVSTVSLIEAIEHEALGVWRRTLMICQHPVHYTEHEVEQDRLAGRPSPNLNPRPTNYPKLVLALGVRAHRKSTTRRQRELHLAAFDRLVEIGLIEPRGKPLVDADGLQSHELHWARGDSGRVVQVGSSGWAALVASYAQARVPLTLAEVYDEPSLVPRSTADALGLGMLDLEARAVPLPPEDDWPCWGNEQ